jgi:hypothetical protein
MSEPFHDETLKKRLRALSRITAPQSSLDVLMRRVREGETEEKNPYSSFLTFLMTVRQLFARKVLAAVMVTLLISVPFTFFLTSQHFSKIDTKTFVVRFVYENKAAENVRIVGDFNNWSRSGMSMKRVQGTDYWTVEIPLEEGIYRYVFLVDNNEWTPDPLSEIKTHDNFGNESSLLLLLNNPEEGINL